MMRLYHVTDQSCITSILKAGLLPGWGDLGLGVYLFDDALAALEYAEKGGWDGDLSEPVLLEVEAEDMDVEPVVPDPAWPDPETYDHIWWHPSESEDLAWMPLSIVPMANDTPGPG